MFRTAISTAILLGVTGLAHAQATVKPDGQMRSALGLGASFSSGNTKATNVTLTADAVRATAVDKISLYGTALYARSNGVTTGDQLRLGGRYDYNINAAWFAFGGLDFERNPLANLNLRGQASGGLGYHAIKTESTTWDLFGGLAYTSDKYKASTVIDGKSRDSYNFASLVLAEESTHKLSDTTTAKQRLALLPNLTTTGEYRATWDAALAVAMSKSMNLTVGLGVTYNSQPGTGIKSTDALLTTGVSVKFD